MDADINELYRFISCPWPVMYNALISTDQMTCAVIQGNADNRFDWIVPDNLPGQELSFKLKQPVKYHSGLHVKTKSQARPIVVGLFSHLNCSFLIKSSFHHSHQTQQPENSPHAWQRDSHIKSLLFSWLTLICRKGNLQSDFAGQPWCHF